MAYSDLSFIEVQFPVSKVSKESYKERKANLGQTLTVSANGGVESPHPR